MYGYALAEVMERVNRAFCCFIIVIACLYVDTALAVYETQISNGITWLENQQNIDGSWGASEGEKRLLTSESVDALRALGYRQAAYYKGITWLENHGSVNTDFIVRRAKVLNAHGDSTTEEILSLLSSAQDITQPVRAGWGSNPIYVESPADTALVLQGLAEFGATAGTTSLDVQTALDYLKLVQLTGSGWPLSLGVSSDAWSTALIVKALSLWLVQDASLATPINEGMVILNTLVTTVSPEYLQALAAQAALTANKNVSALLWLNSLAATQLVNGSWSNQIYDTVLSLRAMAQSEGSDSVANQGAVTMPDVHLRMAINAVLGRNALDALNCVELSQLTELIAVDVGIVDLTGLECATNLTLLDLRDNKITSVMPIEHLFSTTVILLEGNFAETLLPTFNIPIPIMAHLALSFIIILLAKFRFCIRRAN